MNLKVNRKDKETTILTLDYIELPGISLSLSFYSTKYTYFYNVETQNYVAEFWVDWRVVFLFVLWLGRDNAEDLIRARFAQNHLEIDAFSSMRYIGVQTVCPPTSFMKLQTAVTAELNNTAVRSPRNPQLVFATLKVSDSFFTEE